MSTASPLRFMLSSILSERSPVSSFSVRSDSFVRLQFTSPSVCRFLSLRRPEKSVMLLSERCSSVRPVMLPRGTVLEK